MAPKPTPPWARDTLPGGLPASMVPLAHGCDYRRAETTPERCRRWAVALWAYEHEGWNAIGRKLLSRLCDAKCARCCETLAGSLRDGVGGPKDPKDEQRYRDAACKLGRGAQCIDVERELAREKDERARLARECDSGRALACLDLGEREWRRDRSARGLIHFDSACRLGNQAGCVRASEARAALNGVGPW